MIDFLFRAIKYLPCRLGLIERWLELDPDENDYTSIQEAYTRGNEKIGAYYYWYLQKKIVAGYVRDSNRERMLKIVRKMDQTDYKNLDLLLPENQGTVIAIPHYGHYIAPIISAMVKSSRIPQHLHVYEKSMLDKIIYWQYIRQHFRKEKKFPFLSPDMFTDTWDNFIADPRTTVDLSKIIALD